MVAVEVEAAAWDDAVADVEGWTRRVAAAALRAGLQTAPPRPEPAIAILLADDDAVRDLNARFRGHDAATNVLSFPAAESARPNLGDIALAYGVCAAEARAQAKPLRDHLAHLVAHGVLHLFGYDHLTDADAASMEEMEREILRGFGVADPYAPREADVEL